ncbi:hypothetical protein ABKV19_016946 [Rosa sericea]
MVLSKPCALVYSSLLLFLLLLFFSEVAFARLSASSKSKKTELDLLMDFGSDKVTRSFAGQVKLSKGYLSKKLAQDNYEDINPKQMRALLQKGVPSPEGPSSRAINSPQEPRPTP